MVTEVEPAAFESVYSREYAGLVRLAYMTTGSVGAAEEVVQEVFAAWLRRGAHVREPAAYLRRLRPRQRAAVFLRYYLDLPESEIAAALGCRVGTVKSMLHRSLGTMKEFLGEFFDE